MKDTLTVTTKGTITIPAKIRKAMNINQNGDRIQWTFDAKTNRLTLEKRIIDLLALQERMTKLIKPGTKPLVDVDAFYQKRPPRI